MCDTHQGLVYVHHAPLPGHPLWRYSVGRVGCEDWAEFDRIDTKQLFVVHGGFDTSIENLLRMFERWLNARL